MITWHPTHVTREVYNEDGSRHALSGKMSSTIIIGKVGNSTAYIVIHWPGWSFACYKGWDESPFAECETGKEAKQACQDDHAQAWLKRKGARK